MIFNEQYANENETISFKKRKTSDECSSDVGNLSLFIHAFWIGWKPTTCHTFFLFCHFFNAPKRRESKKRNGSIEDGVFYTQRQCHAGNANGCKRRAGPS